jgi:hypothetical protein
MDESKIKDKIEDMRSYIISEYCTVDHAKELHKEIKKYEEMLENLKKSQ